MALFSRVLSVGSYVPDNILSNHDLSTMMDTSDEWIKERSGIEERRIAPVELGTSDLGYKAALEALDRANLKPTDIDFIVAATLSPDYYFPGIGVLIQAKLGPLIPAIDVRGQCSGFSWALSCADAYIRAGLYKRVLVVGAEIHTRVLDYTNFGRNVSILFGDGAGAVILEATSSEPAPHPTNSIRGIIDHVLGCDGAGVDYLAMKRPGMEAGAAKFVTTEDVLEKTCMPFMDGRQVFKNAVTRMTETGFALLNKYNLRSEDINLLIPHQANIRINLMVAEKLGLKDHQIFNNIHKFGNTTAATIPLCLRDAEEQGRLKKGDLVLMLAFGSGFTWGGNLVRW